MNPERHPLNTSFEWTPTRAPFRRIKEEHARRYDEDGYFVLEDACAAEMVRTLLAEIDPMEAEAEALLRGLPDGRYFIARAGEITFTPHLVTRSQRLREFCAGAVVPRPRARPDRTRRAPVLGAGRLQEARDRGATSRGTRTTATPTSSRSST